MSPKGRSRWTELSGDEYNNNNNGNDNNNNDDNNMDNNINKDNNNDTINNNNINNDIDNNIKKVGNFVIKKDIKKISKKDDKKGYHCRIPSDFIEALDILKSECGKSKEELTKEAFDLLFKKYGIEKQK